MLHQKIASIFLVIILFGVHCHAQKKLDSIRHYNNAVYLEFGGPTLIYSIGYERTWYQQKWFAAMSSVGFSYIPAGITMAYIEPGVLFRHKNIALELGIALMDYTEGQQNEPNSSGGSNIAKTLTLTARMGARFFTKNQRFHFRLGITPIKEIGNNSYSGNAKDNRPFLWYNVFTIGYRF